MSLSLTILSLFTGRCLWVPRIQGGTSQVKFCQSEHAALMTTCITPPWCHRNSAPLKLECLGTLTTPQSPRSLALRPRFQKQYVLLVAKTNRISLQHSVSFCLIDLLGPAQVQWLSCTLTERDLAVSHLLPNTRCQMRKYVRCARSLYSFENWKCKYYPQPLNLTIYNSYWVKLLAISCVSILFSTELCLFRAPSLSWKSIAPLSPPRSASLTSFDERSLLKIHQKT